MKLVWSERSKERIRDLCRYIARHFYADYARTLRSDVIATAKRAAQDPEAYPEAFPEIERPEIRKILCASHRHYVYYQILSDRIEVMSVMHTLQEVKSLADL